MKKSPFAVIPWSSPFSHRATLLRHPRSWIWNPGSALVFPHLHCLFLSLVICQALGINVLPCLSTRSVVLTPPSSHTHTDTQPHLWTSFLLFFSFPLSVHLLFNNFCVSSRSLGAVNDRLASSVVSLNHTPTIFNWNVDVSSDLRENWSCRSLSFLVLLFCVLERHVKLVWQALQYLVSTILKPFNWIYCKLTTFVTCTAN